MRYTRLESCEIPQIKPTTPYLILLDGTIILQGFGVIHKCSDADEAEIFFKTSKSFDTWNRKLTSSEEISDKFEKFVNDAKLKQSLR